MHRHEVVVLISLLYLLVLDVEGLCPPNTQCFGNGDYNAKAQSCKCYTRRRIGSFTGECCESVDCKPNATCVHGFCGADGLTCKRCLTGWTGLNCEKVDSCFPWLHCVHGSCKKSRMKCECEPGWVGDLCDRSLCTVNCTYGACPNDPKKCECYENFYSPETGCDRSYCAKDWECKNGGYCVDLHHCACPAHYTGNHCETISGCGVPCENGHCSKSPYECECVPGWGPKGKCTKYVGACSNCNSEGGTCEDGPNTCKCKPGYTGLECAQKNCDGCENGSCDFGPLGLKKCRCDEGWANEIHVPGFNLFFGPCTKVKLCLQPCVHGSCPNDPYECECDGVYTGKECDRIQCPVCCPPLTCDCSKPKRPKCLPSWHHDCCLVKSCFTGDTLVHTANGMVPIEKIEEGDLVIVRHEDDAPAISYLRRVDQVRKRLFPARDLIMFQTEDEVIKVTPDHHFFESPSNSWMSAKKIKTSHLLQALDGKMVKIQKHLTASELLPSADENELVAVFDLSVNEYDRYSVGKKGILTASCNSTDDLKTRDKQVWGNSMIRLLHNIDAKEIIPPVEKDPAGFPIYVFVIIAVVLGAILLIIVLVRRKKRQRKYDLQRESLIAASAHAQ